MASHQRRHVRRRPLLRLGQLCVWGGGGGQWGGGKVGGWWPMHACEHTRCCAPLHPTHSRAAWCSASASSPALSWASYLTGRERVQGAGQCVCVCGKSVQRRPVHPSRRLPPTTTPPPHLTWPAPGARAPQTLRVAWPPAWRCPAWREARRHHLLRAATAPRGSRSCACHSTPFARMPHAPPPPPHTQTPTHPPTHTPELVEQLLCRGLALTDVLAQVALVLRQRCLLRRPGSRGGGGSGLPLGAQLGRGLLLLVQEMLDLRWHHAQVGGCASVG